MSSYSTRGRARGRYSFASRGNRSDQRQKSELPDAPMGELLCTWTVDNLQQNDERSGPSASISNSCFVTSFNWLPNTPGQATILVPGEPPKWTPPKTPQRLSEDSGTYFRDKNAVHFPQYPMEPTVKALLDIEPDLAGEIDFVVCGSSFGNLLRFVLEESVRFRILVEVVGSTVFLIRRERSPTEIIEDVRGFGHSFPEAYTTWSDTAKRSESHQRLIMYTFAGVQIMMRYESDGYLPEDIVNGSTAQKPTSWTANDFLPTVDNLLMSLSTSAETSHQCDTTGQPTLKITRGGRLIPQRQTFDLKTRSIRKINEGTMSQELPRLWARRIPNFILAHHRRGVFEDIEIQNVEKKVKEWEEQHERQLACLGVLLRRIQTIVMGRSDKRIEVVVDKTSQIEMRAQVPDVIGVLSDYTRAEWKEAVDLAGGAGVSLMA